VTAPLWLAPATLAALVGLPVIGIQKALGLACTLLATWLAIRDVMERFIGWRGAWVTAVVVGAQSSLGIWSIAGLETGAATLAFTSLALAALARPRPRGVAAGVSAAALLWLRPECAIAASLQVVAAAARDRRQAPWAAATFVGALIAVVVFRGLAFGNPFPLAFHAKPGSFETGFDYVIRGLLVLTGGVGTAIAAFGALRGTPTDRLLGGALLAHVAAVAIAGGDWMPGFRLLAPALPAYGMLVGLGVARFPRADAWAIAGLAVAAAWVPALDLGAELPRAREAGRIQEDTGRALSLYLERYQTVALVDIGLVGWSTGLEIVDLGGITDPVIGRARGGHLAKEVPVGYLAARAPDALVLHSSSPPRVDDDDRLVGLAGYPVEMRIAASPWGQRFRVVHVVRYAPDYYYVVLEAPRDQG
jgi:hypothetical protein